MVVMFLQEQSELLRQSRHHSSQMHFDEQRLSLSTQSSAPSYVVIVPITSPLRRRCPEPVEGLRIALAIERFSVGKDVFG